MPLQVWKPYTALLTVQESHFPSLRRRRSRAVSPAAITACCVSPLTLLAAGPAFLAALTACSFFFIASTRSSASRCSLSSLLSRKGSAWSGT